MISDLLTFTIELLTPCIPLQDSSRRYIASSSLKEYIASTIIPGAWHYTDESVDEEDEMRMSIEDDKNDRVDDDDDDSINAKLSMKELIGTLTVELDSWPGLIAEWESALYVVWMYYVFVYYEHARSCILYLFSHS